jgi:hypothetical protein
VEILQREQDTDELGDDDQEIQDEQVADSEPAAEPAEPLVDQPGVPDTGDRAEPDHLSWLTVSTGISRTSVHSRV